MQNDFHTLADALPALLQGGEVFTCSFNGEQSDFVRFNGGAVRQAGTVTQRVLSLDLIEGRRHAAGTLTLSGDAAADRGRLAHLVG
ncbi:MAG: TldD/PmbA family protein, partial [Candidatus Binatia bacterium]